MNNLRPLKSAFLFVVLSLLLGISPAFGATAKPAKSGQILAYVGTYTGPKSQGIYLCRLDLKTGSLTNLGVAAETVNPTFLALHPNGHFLYAANEISKWNGRSGGSVSAYVIEPETGKLTLLNQQSSVGAGPAHLTVDRAGKNVLVANYGGGSVAALPIKADGSLAESSSFIQHAGSSADAQRQKEPHAHSINVAPDNRFAFAADLGLDKVLVYRLDAKTGTLTPNDPPFTAVKPGSGPRHFAFHPSGRYAYVINEMLSTVIAFSYDASRGVLTELQTLPTLPENFTGKSSTAEVQVHPSGKFLYGSNRGHDSIAVFAINERTGKLTFVEHQSTQGKTPRNFAIDPTGAYLLAENQGSDNVVVFRIDPKTGRLQPTGNVSQVPAPVCIKFLPR